MVSRNRSQVKGHLGQGHEIFRVGVKLIKSGVLKVSSRSDGFYASYSRKTDKAHPKRQKYAHAISYTAKKGASFLNVADKL